MEEGFLEMMTREDDIKILIQIVKKDLDIQEKRRFLDEAPARIRKIRQEVAEMEREIEEETNEFKKLAEERRHLEREIDAQNDKIKYKRQEQTKINDNKIFRALSNEIDYLTKIVDTEEERILAILEKTEGKKKEFEERKAAAEQRKEELLAKVDGLERELSATEESLKIIEDEKVRVLPHLSPKVRRMYDRILKVKGDSGVANLIGDVCQGCYSRVPPQQAHEIRRNDRIMTCEVCGRILVYYEPE